MKTEKISTRKGELSYLIFGKGAPAIIIPGMSLCSVLSAAEGIAAAFSTLAETHTVYLFDRQEVLEIGTSVEDMAEDLNDALELLGVKNADVYGASQGAMMAICLAAKHKDKVKKLLLAAPMAAATPLCRKVIGEWEAHAKAKNLQKLNNSITQKVYSKAFFKANETYFKAHENEGSEKDLARFCVLCDAALGFDGRTFLKEITCPALVVGALEDRVLSVEGCLETAEILGCESRIFQGFGHAVYDENPDFIPLLCRFFNT